MNCRNFALLAAWAALVAATAAVRAQDTPQMPEMAKPTAEHQRLEQFAGEWTSECKIEMPGQEPITCTGAETSRMMGGLWLLATGKGEMPDGQTGESLITLGYDPAKKSYVGTFVCSAQDIMWEYTGKFDESGKKLVLSTEGPSMLEAGKTAKYEETLELVDADHKTFTSKIQLADGKWQELVKMNYTRVK
jgi:hypothetical protein